MIENKKILLKHFQVLETEELAQIQQSVMETFAKNCILDAYHPLNKIQTAEGYFEYFLKDLYSSFRGLKRRNDILIGGLSQKQEWVSTTGYLVGIFEKDYLGIPANGKITHLRFGQSFQLESGKVVRSLLIIDLIDLMRQASYRVLPPDLGDEMLIPAPQTTDGVILSEQDSALSQESLQIIEDMLFKGLMSFDGKNFGGMSLEKYWHHQMMWYGPAGIGSSQGIDGFQAYHQIPFLIAFPDRKGGNHDVRFAEGRYAVSNGLPSLKATHSGSGWLGLAATNKRVTMRVMDWWRQEQGLLKENWVLIDIIDLFYQLGYNLFHRLESLTTYPKRAGKL